MSWRPENWADVKTKAWQAATQVGEQFPVGFEAGADAMIEAIIILDSIAWKKFLNNKEEILK